MVKELPSDFPITFAEGELMLQLVGFALIPIWVSFSASTA